MVFINGNVEIGCFFELQHNPVENFLMFDNAYKNDQKVHFFVNLYTNICQRNMQKKTVDIIRLIICYSI